jgi:hypothetical protein
MVRIFHGHVNCSIMHSRNHLSRWVLFVASDSLPNPCQLSLFGPDVCGNRKSLLDLSGFEGGSVLELLGMNGIRACLDQLSKARFRPKLNGACASVRALPMTAAWAGEGKCYPFRWGLVDSSHGLQSDPLGNGRTRAVIGEGWARRFSAVPALLFEIPVGRPSVQLAAGFLLPPFQRLFRCLSRTGDPRSTDSFSAPRRRDRLLPGDLAKGIYLAQHAPQRLPRRSLCPQSYRHGRI